MSAKDYRVPEPGYKDYDPPFPEVWWMKIANYARLYIHYVEMIQNNRILIAEMCNICKNIGRLIDSGLRGC